MIKKKKVLYSLSGIVWGNCWGGGVVGYPSERIKGTNKQKLLKRAKKMLSDGSLDSGMGFESLTGATLTLATATTITVEDKDFVNEEYEDVFLGKITEKQEDSFYKEGL